MSPVPFNPINPQQFSQTGDRVTTDVQRYCSPTGQIADIIVNDLTIDSNGVWKTEKLRECIPPLADGRIPDSPKDIRECCRCQGLIHVESSYICPVCNLTFCIVCTTEFSPDKDKSIRLCIPCVEKATTTPLQKFYKWIVG